MSDSSMPKLAQPAMGEIQRGMALSKCRKCGCMKAALDQAEEAFGASEDATIRGLVELIREQRERMEPIAYDCIGCKKCWGAEATIKLAEDFEGVELGSCEGGPPSDKDLPVDRRKFAEGATWPPYPGDYVLGDPEGTVAVCTLSNRELPALLVESQQKGVAIAGRCDTENIGIEKVVLNMIANPRLRWLVLAGTEAKGHRAGDAFLNLQEKGVDANMKVLDSASWRPILKNLSLLDVARFREQVEVVNLIGNTHAPSILKAAEGLSSKSRPPLEPYEGGALRVKRIQARNPEVLKLDPAGFFIVLPNLETGVIVCEHYRNDGSLANVVEGRKAALVASTIVENGLISRLDHAAYLGRELAKAEIAIQTKSRYEQDAALGELPDAGQCPNTSTCNCH